MRIILILSTVFFFCMIMDIHFEIIKDISKRQPIRLSYNTKKKKQRENELRIISQLARVILLSC